MNDKDNIPFTWEELANEISKLPKEEQKKQCCISIDDESRFKRVASLETIPEDIYQLKEDAETHGSDENCGTLEDLRMSHDPIDGEFRAEDYVLVTPKGTPFMSDGFR